MNDLKHYEELRAAADSLLAEVEALRATIAPQVEVLLAKRAALNEEADAEAGNLFQKIGFAGMTDASLLPHIYKMGWNDGLGSSKWREIFERELKKADLYMSSYGGGWHTSDDVVIYRWSLCLPKLENLDEDKFVRTAAFLESLCKAHEIFEGDFVVSIFEHTLSEHGCFYLVYDREEAVWAVSRSTWGVVSSEEGGSLEETLREIARYHWYE